ncbi:hypothetical protein JW960_14880 [candidate division KSB1 bacterium]|nr:hypothetical protein [candidate division KSB1 bacterium]
MFNMYSSKKYRRVYNKLTNFVLQHEPTSDKWLSDDDILGDLSKKARPHLFLDFYSEEGMRTALEQYGIFRDLNKRGFQNLIMSTDTNDPFRHKFRAYYEKQDADHLLCEAYLRKTNYVANPVFTSKIAGQAYSLIIIDWLMLQDPTAEFSSHRPPLPGQKYPGLRIGRKVLDIFHNMALRLKADGLLNVPEHYHNAFFYGRAFKYFNPESEGHFRAIQRDLRQIRLNKAAWGIEWGCLVEANSAQYWPWFTDEQVYPVGNKLKSYFDSKEYKDKEEDAYQKVKFYIDEKKFNGKLNALWDENQPAYFGD